MRKLLPVLLAILGLGAGVGAGWMLKSPAATAEHSDDPSDHGSVADAHSADVVEDEAGEIVSNPCGDPTDTEAADAHDSAVDSHGEPTREFVKLNNQFIVPVIKEGSVGAMVILSINLEVRIGTTEQVYSFEPKLRDAFLQVLFDHANSQGFEGAFTQANNMKILRVALLESARKSLGNTIVDVLIVDIVRQDV